MRNAARLSFGLAFLVVASMALMGSGCGSGGSTATNGTSTGTTPAPSVSGLKGEITIDGSSTVLPISAAVMEEFGTANKDIRPSVNSSGTGGGFKKFAAGEIDIAGASRPIEAEEAAACKANGIEFVEIPVAYDGLSLVVNKENDFCEELTVAQLKAIWESGSKVKTWRDVNPAWPAEAMKLYGAGTDSGTFDYFTEEICGKKGNSRTDYQPSEDDNILVKGVEGDKYALAYFGYGYYEQNEDKLKLVKVDGVAPSGETILSGEYKPLSRPLFWYVNAKALDRPEVKALVEYMLKDGKDLVASTGYVPLPEAVYAKASEIATGKKLGTRFGESTTGAKLEDVLGREGK